MKRIACLLLCVCLAIAFTGCNALSEGGYIPEYSGSDEPIYIMDESGKTTLRRPYSYSPPVYYPQIQDPEPTPELPVTPDTQGSEISTVPSNDSPLAQFLYTPLKTALEDIFGETVTLSHLEKIGQLTIHDETASNTVITAQISGRSEDYFTQAPLNVSDADFALLMQDLTQFPNLTKLDITYQELTTLTGIEALPQLIWLDVTGNDIVDFSAVGALTELIFLRAHWNQITDISALSTLTKLEILDLQRNSITDVSALTGLTSLRTVDLGENQITALPEANNLSITSLDLLLNAGLDITNIGSWLAEDISYLRLSNCELTDISPLRELNSTEQLWLNYNSISDLSPLTSMQADWLILSGNQITDVTPVATMTVTSIHLDDNLITDASPLGQCTTLTLIEMDANQVSNISGFENLTLLEDLALRNNQLADISPLSGLTSLTKLDLHGNLITDVTPLAGLVNLETLYIGENPVTDLTPLDGLDAFIHTA